MAVYLFQGFFCGTVHFELKNVNGILLPHNCVASAFAVLHFAQDKLAHQFENEPDKCLTVKFILFLVCLFWSSGENVVNAEKKDTKEERLDVKFKCENFDLITWEYISK